MIMNKGMLSGTNPFRQVSIQQLSKAFVAKNLHLVNNVWLVSGNISSSNSHPVLAQSNDGVSFTTTEFTYTNCNVTGAGFTNNGYILFSDDNGYCDYIKKAIGAVTEGTDSTRIYRASGSAANCKDIAVYENAAYVVGYHNSSYPALNLYAPVVPSFNSTWSPGGGYTSGIVSVALAGKQPTFVMSDGHIGGKDAVGNQYLSRYGQISESLSGLVAKKIAYYGGYFIVGGKRSDGTYIWYTKSTAPDGNSVWTEQKVSDTSGEVFGIAHVNGHFIVLYVKSDGGKAFWASKRNNIAQTLVTDYWDARFTVVDNDAPVAIKSNGTFAVMVTQNATTIHITKIM